MSFDFFAEFFKLSREEERAEELLKELVKAQGNFKSVKDLYARITLLTQLRIFEENNKRLKDQALNELKNLIHPSRGKKEAPSYTKELIKPYHHKLESLGLLQPDFADVIFPKGSFWLKFDFSLARPYLSRDDVDFHICDNPVRKDKVFKIPMISSTSWKGNLRWAIRIQRELMGKSDDEVVLRLFGNEKGEEETEKLHSGRLQFYPTFFNDIGMEVINPHDREKRAGKMPIYFESAPPEAKGNFSLLYVPFDIIGDKERLEEVEEDTKAVIDALAALMLNYGFSAKKTSGFGIIDKLEDGSFEVAKVSDKFSFGHFNELKQKAEKIDWSLLGGSKGNAL